MEKFRIVANNLCGLMMQTRMVEPPIPDVPVVMDVSDTTEKGDDFYETVIKVTVFKLVEESEATLYVEFRFAPLLYIACGVNPETIVKEQLPRHLFNHVRALVWNLSSEANMPLMLEDEAWIVREADSVQRDAEQNDERKTSVSDKQYEAFDTIIKAFKDIPSYEYYYRFLCPVEYDHPHFEGCNEEIWAVLYQLLFGGLHIDCHLEKNLDGSLELWYCDVNGCDDVVSNLTLHNLELLIMHLWSELGNDILRIMEPENLNQEVGCDFEDGVLSSKEKFFSLYNVEGNRVDNNLLATLEKMYDKIVKCDAESLPYRC